MNNESFKAHKAHVVYGQVSCAHCHHAHGSNQYQSLMRFDSSMTYPNSRGQFLFLPLPQGMPRCLLSCHVQGKKYDHKVDDKLQYSVNDKLPQGW